MNLFRSTCIHVLILLVTTLLAPVAKAFTFPIRPSVVSLSNGSRPEIKPEIQRNWMLFQKESDDERASSCPEGEENMRAGETPDESEQQQPPIVTTSTVRMDDGGSDLTDRFKYKVNALMGVFDPTDAATDTDKTSGNILNAMLTFPVQYSFNVVGRTTGDQELVDEFIRQVKSVVLQGSGDNEENVLCQVTPRGKSFTKVTVQAQVDSAPIITAIYEELERLELSVMQF